jgi:multiple sugar transport system permease protein
MQKSWQGWLYLLPSLVGLVAMIYGPILVVFALGFTSYDVLNPPRWIGLRNFVSIFTNPLFWKVLLNTVYFTIATGLASIVFAMVLALLVSAKLKGVGIFRTIFFIPVIVSMVSAAFVWKWIFSSQFGILNYLLSLLGFPRPLWFDNPRYAMPALIIMTVWKNVGYNMVIFLAGLKNLPREMHAAAWIDGASYVQRLFRITLPLLSPTTFFVIVVTLINSFLVFEQSYVMTNGGPANATLTFALLIYNNAFLYFKMGYASALSFLFFLLILAITLVQNRFSKKWVFYQ